MSSRARKTLSIINTLTDAIFGFGNALMLVMEIVKAHDKRLNKLEQELGDVKRTV